MTATTVCGAPSVSLAQSCRRESRLILDEGWKWIGDGQTTIDTRRGTHVVLSRIKEAGFNVFVPLVWGGGGTAWPSDLSPWAGRWVDHDPFGHLVNQAPDYGIEIHPWVTISKRKGDFLPEFADEGTPEKAFNVLLPEYQEFIVELCADLLTRYPSIRGLNLDYIRTGGICTSAFCADDYRKFSGRNLLADVENGWADPESKLARERWQEGPIRNILAGIREKQLNLNPGAVLSVDAAPWYPPIKYQGQQSVDWANSGLVDLILSMNYVPDPDFERLAAVAQELKNPEKLAVIVGNYDKDKEAGTIESRSVEHMTYLLSKSRQFRPDGPLAVYIYSMLSDLQVEGLASGVFSECAQPNWACCDARA